MEHGLSNRHPSLFEAVAFSEAKTGRKRHRDTKEEVDPAEEERKARRVDTDVKALPAEPADAAMNSSTSSSGQAVHAGAASASQVKPPERSAAFATLEDFIQKYGGRFAPSNSGSGSGGAGSGFASELMHPIPAPRSVPSTDIIYLHEYKVTSMSSTDLFERPQDLTDLDLTCSICLDVCRNPSYSIKCATRAPLAEADPSAPLEPMHCFCRVCLEEHISKCPAGEAKCPNCQLILLTEDLRKCDPGERLGNQIVHCVYDECSRAKNWFGPFRDLQAHVDQRCGYKPMKCLDCSNWIRRKDFAMHQTTTCPEKSTKCTQCLQMVKFRQWEDHEARQCQEFLCPCPNACSPDLRIPRRLLSSHSRDTCPAKTIPCEFGCGVTLTRAQMDAQHNVDPKAIATHIKAIWKRLGGLAGQHQQHQVQMPATSQAYLHQMQQSPRPAPVVGVSASAASAGASMSNPISAAGPAAGQMTSVSLPGSAPPVYVHPQPFSSLMNTSSNRPGASYQSLFEDRDLPFVARASRRLSQGMDLGTLLDDVVGASTPGFDSSPGPPAGMFALRNTSDSGDSPFPSRFSHPSPMPPLSRLPMGPPESFFWRPEDGQRVRERERTGTY